MESKDSINVKFCKPISEISAIADHKGQIYIGTNKGQIIRLKKDQNSNSYVQEWPGPNQIIPIESSSVIRGLFSVTGQDKHLYALICSSGTTGKIMEVIDDPPFLVNPSEKGRETTIRAKFISVNKIYGINSKEKLSYCMAIAEGNKIQLFEYVTKESEDERKTRFIFKSGETQDILQLIDEYTEPDGDIAALSINNKGIAYYAGGKYKFKEPKKQQPFDVSSVSISNPLILPFDDASFIFCLPATMLLKNFGAMNIDTSFQYNKGIPSISNERPTTMVLYHEKLLQFFPKAIVSGRITPKYQEDFTMKPYSKATLVEPFNDSLITVLEDEVRIYGGTTLGTRCGMLVRDHFDEAIAKFNKEAGDNANEEIIDMFKYPWNNGDFSNALDVLSIIQWPHDICEVISLFSPNLIELPKKFERVLLANACKIPQEVLKTREMKNSFCTFLERTHDFYSASAKQEYNLQIQVINLCRFQFYANNLLTEKLEELVDKKNKHILDDAYITKFLSTRTSNPNLYPAYAIYQASKGINGIKDSVLIWKNLLTSNVEEDKKWFAEGAARTLRLIPPSWKNGGSGTEENKLQNELFNEKVDMIKTISKSNPHAAVKIFEDEKALYNFREFTYINRSYYTEYTLESCEEEGVAYGVYNYATMNDSEEAKKRLESVKEPQLIAIAAQFCNLLYIVISGGKPENGTEVFIDEGAEQREKEAIIIKKINGIISTIHEKDVIETENERREIERENITHHKRKESENGNKTESGKENKAEGEMIENEKKSRSKEKIKEKKKDELIKIIDILKGEQMLKDTNIFNKNNYTQRKEKYSEKVESSIIVKNLIRDIYCVANNYKEGIDYIISNHKDLKTRKSEIRQCLYEIEDFCREATVPENAFAEMMRMFKTGQMGENSVKAEIRKSNDFIDFLLRNFEWIEMDKLIDNLIDDDASIESCADIFRVAEAVINEKERMARMRYDISRSLNIDAKYRRVIQEKRNVEIQVSTLCKKCGKPVGAGMIKISPTNEVYHIPCARELGVPEEEYEPQYI